MAVTYTKTGFVKVLDALRDLINNEFRNVYISDTYMDKTGGEAWRLNLLRSTEVLTHRNFEVREYDINLRYYMENLNSEKRTTHVMNNVDRMKKHLIDNIAYSTNWAELLVEDIEYNIQDDENEEKPGLSITDLSLKITSTVAYS